MALRVGVDTGGTFTDLVVLDEDTGELAFGKRPSTPAAPAQGVFDAFEASGASPTDADAVVLGTTVATNALLERKGAEVLYLTTEGFEDIALIQRVDKKDPYDLQWQKPRPFVRRRNCLGVRERVAWDGRVLLPLAREELRRVERWVEERLAELEAEGATVALAVNLLFSYANPAHERELAEHLRRRFPGFLLSVSHKVAPVWREYERASTTILDAFLGPTVAQLVGDCERGLSARGFRGAFSESAGGGGYGDPLEREVELVLEDVSEGVVTPDAVREEYGVALRLAGGSVLIDDAETRRIRASS